MEMSKRYHSSFAMKIVGMDRQRFNEVVSAGQYNCAPATLRGSSRLFNEDDMLTLFIFARLSELGIPPLRAGEISCQAGHLARGNDVATRIIYFKGEFSSGVCLANKEKRFDGVIVEHDFDKQVGIVGNGRTLYTIEFCLENIRNKILEKIKYEMNIIGENYE